MFITQIIIQRTFGTHTHIHNRRDNVITNIYDETMKGAAESKRKNATADIDSSNNFYRISRENGGPWQNKIESQCTQDQSAVSLSAIIINMCYI